MRPIRRALREEGADLLPRALYVARTLLACGLALWLAFALQLRSPMSSMTTVLIVANPVPGALISKSLWRVAATILGSVAAVVLMAMFAQSPLLFTVALSICIGIACAVSTLLRYFRAYAAVLSAYTIIMVCAGTFDDPLGIFDAAVSRASSVVDGVVCTCLVFLLTAVPRPAEIDRTIEAVIRDMARAFGRFRLADAALAAEFARTMPRVALMARIAQLDETVEYASTEDGDVRRRRAALRRGLARILGLLGELEPLHDALRGTSPAAREAQLIAHRAMGRLATDGFEARAGIAEDHAALERLAAGGHDPAALAVVLHECDLLERLCAALADLAAPDHGATPLRLRPYLDVWAASRNGLRGLLVTLVGGLFWYATQWPSGPTLLLYVIPAACLLSTNASASRASVQFAGGTLAAIPVAFVVETFVLPSIDGFPLLWCALSLGVLPAVWMQLDRRRVLAAFGYCVFFGSMVSVHNPNNFDDTAALNTWLAFLVGAICLVLVFRVLLPANPSRDVERLRRSLVRAAERLARAPSARVRAGRAETWQHLQMQKLRLLAERLRLLPEVDAVPVILQASALVALGRTIVALHELRTEAPGAGAALEALAQLHRDPAGIADRLRGLAAGTDAESTRSARLLVGHAGEAALRLAVAAPFVAGRAAVQSNSVGSAGAR